MTAGITSRALLLASAVALLGGCPLVGLDTAVDQYARTVNVGGLAREYVVQQSRGRDGGAAPLLISLHGGSGTADRLARTGGFRPIVARENVVVMYPQAIDRAWNVPDLPRGGREGQRPAPDDVAFINALIDLAIADYNVDPNRIWLWGVSRGGAMTLHLLSQDSTRIDAAVTAIAGLPNGISPQFDLATPVSVMMINGAADPLIPYAGGLGGIGEPTSADPNDGPGAVRPVEETIARLVALNECDETPTVTTVPDRDPRDGCTAVISEHPNGLAGVRVVLIRVDGGGHVTPGGFQYLPASLIGPACGDFDHAEAAWRFFNGQSVQ